MLRRVETVDERPQADGPVVVRERDCLVREIGMTVERQRRRPLVVPRAQRREPLRELLQLAVRCGSRAKVAAGT